MPEHLRRPLFVITGMNPSGHQVAHELFAQLQTHYLSYPSLAKKVRFDECFECIPIEYESLFSEARECWESAPDSLIEQLSSSGVPKPVVLGLKKLAATAETLSASSNIVNLVLYAFTKEARKLVQDRVAKQIHTVLEARPSIRAGNWSLIAHSLGTAVAHDTLHAMYRKPLSGRKPLEPGKTFMSVLMMAANISRLLERETDVYRSMVRPTSRVGGGICEWYLNVRHEWDPMTMPKPFEPVLGWPTPDSADRLINVYVRHFLDPNIHGLNHYLEDPDVHLPLFEGLTGLETAPRERREARDGFKRRSSGDVFDSVRAQLKEMQLSSEDDWPKVIAVITRVSQLGTQ